MKKFLFSVVVIALCLLGIAATGNLAYLEDTETSAGNKFTAGTLELGVSGGGNPQSAHYTFGPLEPGDCGSVVYELTNSGTLTGYLDLEGVNISNDGGLLTEAEEAVDPSNNGDLGQELEISVTLGGDVIYSGSLNDFAGSYDVSLPVAPGEIIEMVIAWELPSGSGAETQGDLAYLSFNFELGYQPDD